MATFVQDIDQLKSHYKRQEIENRKYRGRIPKKKRIRNKIQKKRESNLFMFDEFHEIDNKNMLIVGTSGKGQAQHYDKNGNRL
ncbi:MULTISPECIES: hypothetical protein [Staphylococcus]|uniref:hypothetical protein n=1 Tax=Staphylococcus TaxID=1279 RepID=UPI00287A0265|nr:hypothetical protein [Staphylococcus hominis]MDS3838002.1 hypothetical protein [Staphylococcus hominis]